MNLPQRILVATDLGEGADEALREGARFAERARGTLGVVHVSSGNDAEQEELAIRARVKNVIGARPVEVFVERGLIQSAIARRALDWKADLIVVGARAPAVLGHVFRGVGERLLLEAHCDVLAVRPNHGHGVIAATDLSLPALPAVVAGAEEAERRGTHLRVVHAVDFWRAETRYLSAKSSVLESRSDYQAFAEELEAAVAGTGIDRPCQVISGATARAIVRDARETTAELIVLAKHPTTEAHANERGVVENVFASAPCSVLVLHAPA